MYILSVSGSIDKQQELPYKLYENWSSIIDFEIEKALSNIYNDDNDVYVNPVIQANCIAFRKTDSTSSSTYNLLQHWLSDLYSVALTMTDEENDYDVCENKVILFVGLLSTPFV